MRNKLSIRHFKGLKNTTVGIQEIWHILFSLLFSGLPRSMRSLAITALEMLKQAQHGKRGMSYHFITFLLLFTLLFLSGCTGDACIDADDFGFANLTVSARYSKSELNEQFGGTQVAPWRDSNFRVNGRPLTILVRHWDSKLNRNRGSEVSAWCAWFSNIGDESKLSNFCLKLQDCRFIDDQMCTNTVDARIANAPCVFRKGVGLYALIADKESDPNLTFETQRAPSGLSFHLGDPQIGYKLYDIAKDGTVKEAGGTVYKYEVPSSNPDDIKRQFADAKLYFKILDKFYDDNSGQYRISIKSGISQVDPDPISYISSLVRNFLFGTGNDYGLIKRIYLGIVNNPAYRTTVSSMLILFIVWTALLFLTGNIQITQTELITRIVKFALVATLLNSQASWNFFHDYLYVFFVEGLDQIINMVIEAGATGPGSSGILALMIAPQTMAKLFSLLFVHWGGFIYIILFFFALYFIVMVYFEATVLYLTALITIGMILIMGPIFICFMLFEFTKPLFQNWLKQLISYAVQPIILFTGIAFISIILRQEIYGALGFRVCKFTFPKLSSTSSDLWGGLTEDVLGFSLGESPFYWWFPDPTKGQYFLRTTTNIPIPIDHFDASGNFCEAYGCVGPRYPDLPFLDPVKDQRRLNGFWNGEFVQFDGLLIIFVAVYLLSKFNGTAVGIAKFIADTSASYNNISNSAASASSGITRYARSAVARTSVGRAVTKGMQMVKQVGKGIGSKIESAIDNRAAKIIKDKATSTKAIVGADKAVLDRVKQNTGLTQADINVGASDKYKKALAASLKEIDPKLSSSKANAIAKKMAYKNHKALPDEFAKAKFGKASFKELDDKQKVEINSLLNKDHKGESLRKLAIDAKQEKRFKNAYFEAHQQLSKEGVGLFGKNVKQLRNFQQLQYSAEELQDMKGDYKKVQAQKAMSGLSSIGSTLYGQTTGNKPDKNSFGGRLFTDKYDEINQEDKGFRTRNDKLKEAEYELAKASTDKEIAALSENAGTSVISPEFLAKIERHKDFRYNKFQSLAQENVSELVHEELYSGDDPIVKGERYMREYAKDTELQATIDNLKAATYDIFENDVFISREDEYQYELNNAKHILTDEYKLLSEAYGRNDIAVEEMPQLLEKHLEKIADKDDAKELQERVGKLQEAIRGFEETQEIIKQINDRKQMVADEINKEIIHINEIRQSVGMSAYYGADAKSIETNQFRSDKIEKVDSFLRKGK